MGKRLFSYFSDATMSTSADASCYTVVFENSSESPSVQELRSGLEKGSDEVKFDTLRKIIVSTINGNALVYRLACSKSTKTHRPIVNSPKS